MPSHHKRHTPARTANGPIATAAAAPADTANPESISAAQSTTTQDAPPTAQTPQAPQPQQQASQSQPQPPPQQQQQQQQRRAGQGLNITDKVIDLGREQLEDGTRVRAREGE